jgi:hypothetical protein
VHAIVADELRKRYKTVRSLATPARPDSAYQQSI